MSLYNVRVDGALRIEALATEHYQSVDDALLRHPTLDVAHFPPHMQLFITEGRLACQRAPPVRRQYVTRRPKQPLSEVSGGKRKATRCAAPVEPVVPDAAVCERESGVMVISGRLLAQLENRVFQGEYYAFLMTHALQGKKTNTHIGHSTNPIMEIHRRNTRQGSDSSTNACAPHWRAEVFLGPFHCVQKVIRCCVDWVEGTRGKKSKCTKARILARAYNVNIYAHDVPAPPLGRYLARNAPRAYQEAYKRMHSTVVDS
jgi:hypothetical protein